MQAELGKELQEKFIPAWLTSLEKVLADCGTEYFAGDRVSIADICFTYVLSYIKLVNTTNILSV